MKRKFRRRQRGVVLLVVLSLLTLFTLLMVTFIIVSGQYRQSALSAARVSRVEPSPTKLLDNATFTLLRDSNDPKNPIRFHSLLFDMYGGDGFVGEIASNGVGNVGYFASASDGTGGNFFDLRIKVQAPNPLPPATPTTAGEPLDLAGTYHPLSFVDGYYNGCLLTVVSSSVARGRKFRVVDYQAPPSGAFPNPSQHVFRVMPIATSTENSNARPVAGDRVVLNGRPFNGTGFGYTSLASATGPKLDPIYALQPNRVGQTDPTELKRFVFGASTPPNLPAGDVDEGYDAVDFQNMALAAIIPTSTTSATIPQYLTTLSFGGQVTNGLDLTSSFASVPDGLVVIPSFHRMELINYWMSDSSYGTRLDRAIMRPMPWNHPDFDGSNPQLTLAKSATPIRPGDTNFPTHLATQQFLWKLRGIDPLTGNRINPWDVDNDGDRVPDSIWLDLGYPTQTMPDGRQVRPLFAFLCTDLDGRINLNTAGSAGHINNYLAKTPTTKLARNIASSTLPTGQALGSAEINPGYTPTQLTNQGFLATDSYPLFSNANSSDQYATMLFSRYGTNQRPGVTGRDTFAAVKLFEFPTNYFGSTTATAYNSPPDLFGEFAVGLDHRGQPTYDTPQVGRTDMVSDSPYEFDVTSSQRGRADSPFTVAELERVLRFSDATSNQLPSRLTNLGGVAGSVSRRRSVTTESIDVPVPPVLSPSELRGNFQTMTNWQTFPSFNGGRPLSVLDLLTMRLSNGGVASTNINSEIANMLSWDLRAGTRMDVNRPFGNGQDDNGNGVVDEHGSTTATQLEADPSIGEQVWAAGTYFDHDNDGVIAGDTNAYLARYHFARHLYVLAMTLRESSVNIDFDGDATNDSALETARGLAQWAINVVDFRDADSIMTPFEFDTNPFNGWDVDGVLGSADDSNPDRGLVWGCERPELLITETLAFHDRRTEDLSTDPTGNTTSDTTPDDDFDQRLRPRGSLFLELYNPWSGEMRAPAELYTTATAMVAAGVDLQRRAPISPATGAPLTGAPVWRLIVVTGSSHDTDGIPSTWDPRDPDDPTSGFLSSDVERGIYFVDPTATVPALPNEIRHFSSLSMAPLEPGRFAVVGSGTLTGSSYVTTIGRRTDAEDNGQTSGTTNLLTGSTRRIVLTPNASASIQQVQVLDNPGSNTPGATAIQPAIAAVINNGGNLNISEPPGGYPAGANWDSTLASGEGAYITPYDEPFDATASGRDALIADVLDNVTPTATTNPEDRNSSSVGVNPNGVCTVHLQRLANPLVPFNATSNPYRTIDQASIDLTVFEGVYDPGSGSPLPAPRTNAGEPFGGRERGVTGVTPPPNRLWPTQATAAIANPAGGGDPQVFDYLLDSTLGYSNDTFGPRFNNTDAPSAEYVGAPRTTTSGTDSEPFPWLTWNNRPFVSQHEMMLVPHTSSSQLLRKFSVNTTADIYKPETSPIPQPRQFGHLLNFFTTTYFNYGAIPPAWEAGPNLYRLFDYTHVPSRFMGTETWLNPSTFASGNGTALLHPPFDRVFSFREPGKPNINTIFEQRVWDAIRGPNSTLQDFNALLDSRRGYDLPTGYIPSAPGDRAIVFDASVPALAGNPFRGPDAGDLVPVESMKRAGVDATLLRSPTLTPNSATNPHTEAQNDGRFAVTGGDAHIDPFRNPYFRYQNMQRLSNLVTTRSNVYAIWVTMGMFEVTVENNGSGVFVERLGQEAGRETGSVKRHRAFYIVDRSIPVAFQPGENHNVEDAILLRRIIE